MNVYLSMSAVLVSLGALVCAARYARMRSLVSPEYSRKLVHVGMGLVCLSFPWLFSSYVPVLALAAIATAALIAIRVVPALKKRFGCVLNDVGRRSYGEFAFIAGIATAFAVSRGDAISYVVAVNVLIFADTLAALVGKRFGAHRFRTMSGSKSIEGSTAFLVTATACIAIPLYALGQPDAWPIGVTGAVVLMIAEAMAGWGLDNLTIPIAGTLVVHLLTTAAATGALS